MRIDIIGELIKNIGLGIFVYSLYSLTTSNLSIYNFLDLIFSLIAMISGIILKGEIDEY